MRDHIEVRGARVNNLKNIDIDIPHGQLTVIAGVSGSGKSSLAFDTLYAEGQRRYVESLSAYARQFLGRMSKPECDTIKGLPPAIAIEQRVISRNPRSTVGTSTEIYEYLRLLYARIGQTISPISGSIVKKHSTDDIVQQALEFSPGTRYYLSAPLHIHEGRSVERQLQMELQQGFTRLLVKGELVRIDNLLADTETLQRTSPSDIHILIDRMSVDDSKESISRLTDSAETALYEGDGECRLTFLPSNLTFDFSMRFEADGMRFEEPNDNMFSFNSPLGACPTCEGYGKVLGIDERLVIPNSTLSVYDGCVQCWHGEKMKMWQEEFCRRAAPYDFPIFKPYLELSRKEKDWLWHGLPCDQDKDIHDQVSIDAFFKMVEENLYKVQYRVMLSRYKGKTVCPACHGTRLRKEAGYVKIGGKSISDLVEMPIWSLRQWFLHLQLEPHEQQVAKRLLTEINNRLQYLDEVGLSYLTLNRQSNSLSGGESQRINLTTALGSSLVGSLYILDEPSIGLHSRDTQRLIHVLKELQSLGNTVIIVEHDEEFMRAADYLIDVGPDAGRLGGEIVFAGKASDINAASVEQFPGSHTVKYLTHSEQIEVPASRRAWNQYVLVRGARMNNLRGIDVKFPLNIMTVVTGVSGSGKSTLVKGILYPALKRHLGDVCDAPGEYLALEGDWQQLRRIEFVDQNPIGKSSRSNPATYIKAYDAIRQLFADQQLSRQMGFTPQYFSFNADGGRCDECKGAGVITVEMQFMADLELECEACHGQRFKHDILEVRFAGKNINEVLDMTVAEAITFFNDNGQPDIAKRLRPLDDVGLGYIRLGQSSSTLSGGENQRVKLAYYIGQERQDPTLFIFDEPTTGLHFHDIRRLLSAFNALIERGHTILIIEHNMEVIKCADYVIDLGPEGGDKGGNLVFAGTPEKLAQCKESITSRFLCDKLK